MINYEEETRSKKQEARKNLASCLLLLAYLFLPLASCLLLLVNSVSAKECTIMEPEVLKRYIENKSYNMVMFDVRQQFNLNMMRKFDTNMKRIMMAIPASLKDIEKELVGKVEELIGKDVILIGEDTESAISVCRYMMKKDYGIRNIYVLKGGMEKWDGPVREDFLKVECELITSRELMNIMKSNRKVEIIDNRPAEEYYDGHIPGARWEGRGREQLSIKKYLQELERRKKWEQENVTVVYVYDNEWHAMRECRFEKYWSWGYKNIYVLRGGIKTWEGEIKKDYLEILKRKVKERLK
ncbi:MAG: rhodanese-like domain-containing protein [Nitrospinota bacterium]